MDRRYWRRFTDVKVSRRRALRATGAGALGAAFLAACGGDSDDGKRTEAVPRDRSGFLITPANQTSTAKRGGTLSIAASLSAATLEQSAGGNGAGSLLVHNLYNQLMRIKMGTYEETARGDTEPEFAESYETSGDGLTVTFKLRGMKFDDRPPTSGRVSTSEDVKYSWQRFETTNPRAPELANSKTPDGPVLRVETPDAKTAVFKLAFPFAPFMQYLSSPFFPFIYPMEADGKYDPRRIARGTGAWRWEDENSLAGGVTFRRNPNYYHQQEPYFDNLRIVDLAEYSAIASQFEAGALDFHLGLLQEDVLAMKKRNPKLVMYQRPFFAKGCGGVFFGRRPNSPFNDDRVRKAMSIGLDRKLWGDTFSNREKFEGEGLPVEVKWMSGAGPGYHWWLDPEKNELGAANKNLEYNAAEAHKMLVASGKSLPIRSTWHTTPTNTLTGRLNEGMVGLFQASGDFQFQTNVIPTMNEFLETIRNTGGNFDGIGISFYFDHHDFDWTMMLKYHPQSTDFWMKLAGEDPKMTDFVNRQRRELDNKKREQIFQEFTKYDVEKMYYIPHLPADWKPFYIGQPWLGGWGWWQPYIEQYPNGAGQIHTRYWFDASKKTA